MGGWFFPLSKLAWFVLAPSHLVLWLALATAGLLLARRERLGRYLAVATALAFVVFGVLPVGAMLARPLENQYPRPTPAPLHVDGVVSLGGGLDTRILAARQAPGATASEPRLVGAFELARRYPQARIVFSGGWGRNADAVAARYVFNQMGLDPARLVLEDRSRNTYENLAFTQAMVRPKPGEVWLLATSAIQMPRAMAVARRLGWTMVPWPTDYVTTPQPGDWISLDELNIPGNLGLVDAAAHEWVGLLAYGVGGMSGGGGPTPAAR